MQAASGGFAAVIDGNAQTVDMVVGLTLPAAATAYNDVSASVEAASIQTAMTTDMPDGTRIVTGTPASSTDVTLGSATLAWLLNPQDTTSPLFRTTIEGTPVLIQYGVVPAGAVGTVEALTTFVGTVDSYEVDSITGTVVLHCIDLRSRLRAPITLPSFVARDSGTGGKSPGLMAGYVADHILRQNGYHTCPPPRTTGLQMYASMHGSAFPEFYDSANIVLDANPFNATWPTPSEIDSMVPGLYGKQVMPSVSYFAQRSDWDIWLSPFGGTARSYYHEFYVRALTVAPAASQRLASHYAYNGVGFTSDGVQIELIQLAGTLTVQMRITVWRNGGQTVAPTYVGTAVAVNGWMHFAARIDSAPGTPSSLTWTRWINGASATGAVAAGTQTTPENGRANRLSFYATAPIECFQYSTDLTAVPISPMSFAPTAYMDASINMLTAVPDVSGLDAWGILQAFAEAERGVFRFDELGVPRFTSRRTLDAAPSARTIRSTVSLKSIRQTVESASKANVIRQPLTDLSVGPYAGAAWSADQAYTLQALETRTFRVDVDTIVADAYPYTAIPDYGTGLPAGFGPSTSTFRLSTTSDGASSTFRPDFTSVDIRSRSITPTQLEITLTNKSNFTVWFVSPDYLTDVPAGTPWLRIGGRRLKTAPSGARVVSAQRGAADRELVLTVNPFIQREESALQRVGDLLIDLSRPRPIWRDVSIVADARLQLGDRVTIIDPEATGISGDAVIIGIDTALSGTEWGQTLDLRAVGTPGGWLLGVVGRSEMGVTTWT